MEMGLLLIGGITLVFTIVIPVISRMFWEWYDYKKKKKA